MNKALIVIIVVISAYLGYTSINSEEDNASITSEKVSPVKEVNVQEKIVVTPVPENLYDNKKTTLDGRYILNITTKTTETSQVFAFSSNGTFKLNRHMISPNPAISGSIEGTYSITGNTINLVFPAVRDMEAFPVDTATMKIKSETELQYGNFIAILD